MSKDKTVWPTIEGFKKLINCRSCGRRVEVKNFNQGLCERCGYREKSKNGKKEKKK